LWAPIHDGERELLGILVAAFDSEALAQRIARPGANVSLADEARSGGPGQGSELEIRLPMSPPA
jgi:hypothetical protein